MSTGVPRQESGGTRQDVASGNELIGRRVMVGNQLATITDHNQFNRPPFAFEYSDGTREFGWRETFYLLPTRAGIEHALRERLLASNFTSIQHEPLRTQVVDQWVDVLAGTVMSLFDSTTSTKGETQS